MIGHKEGFGDTMRDQVFISYSRKNKKWLERLQLHLKPHVTDGSLDVWDDTRIMAGADWRTEIRTALTRARVAVLLVTPDFLASDFIASEELPSLLNAAKSGGLTILWLAVSASGYQRTAIAKYKAANDPLRPLDKLRRNAEINEELVKIAAVIVDAFHRGERPAKASTPDSQSPGANASRLVEAHFVCRQGLNVVDRRDGTFETGRWAMDPDHVQPGLQFFLHESRATSSYRQGTVLGVLRVETELTKTGKTMRRVTLLVKDTPTPRPWEGDAAGEKGYLWR